MEKISNRIILYISDLILAVTAIFFIIYSFIPQYGIRDHEGYLGGAISLAGYIAFVILMNTIKVQLIRHSETKRKYFYIFSIVDVVASLICVRTLLFYYARVYLLSLVVFWILPALFIILRQIMISRNKTFKINYMEAISTAGVISILSTVVRGMYLSRWQVLLTLLMLCAVIVLAFLGLYTVEKDGEGRFDYFPYDFASWKVEMKAEFLTKYKVSFLIILSLVVLYLLLGPLEIYAGNMLSFSFGYKTFLPLFVIIGIVVLALAPALIALLTKETYKLISIILAAVSLLSYIQCMFMNTKLMEDDGARLRLDTMGNYPVVNLILWVVISIAVVIGLYLIKDNWKITVMGVCGFLSAVQIVAVVSLIITCMSSPAPRYYQLTGDKMFSVAKEENVIVLVPDSFCRKYLDELVDDNPECLNIFKDFTYYDNMDSEYFPTFPSFNHFITGFEGGEELESGLSKERVKWQADAWNSERCKRFFEETSKKGYKFYINIPSACELLGAYEDVCDKVENVEYAESNVNRPLLLKMLFSMSIYRCVPYVFKPPFEYFSWDFAELERYNGKVAAYRNEDFYEEACAGITVDSSVEKKINIINWHGFHEEYTNDEFCNYVPNAESEGITMLQNGKGVLLCISKYLDDLKEIGMYDKSTIIVMGDHGKLYDGCVFIKLPYDENNEIKIDDKLRIYGDFQATILDVIGDDKHNDFGKSWVR